MKLIFKIFIITFLLILFIASHVFAIDMFLEPNSDNNSSSIIENEENVNLFDDYVYTTFENKEAVPIDSNFESVTTTGQSTPTITTTSTVHDNSLTVSDIINIILIAVCIVLIFLAVAILIRNK